MSKPNFWRLKRKAKDKPESSVHNPPKITQKTISSFFGGSSQSSNLNRNAVEDRSEILDPQDNSKRAKLDDDISESQHFSKEKVPAKLSEAALTKLKSFSTSSKKDDVGKSDTSHIHSTSTAKRVSLSVDDNDMAVEDEGDEERGECSSTEQLSSLKSNSEALKSNSRSTAKKQTSQIKLAKVKYTPLEQQVVDIWNQHPGVLLFVECGYRYRFFGEDAEIASQELNIGAYMDHNFMTASIPVHRLHAHISRLVEKGHKVGVVKQTETAALKALSDNKNAPFSRKLEYLFTRATLIGEEVDSIHQQSSKLEEGLSPGHILCLNEIYSEAKVANIIFVAVNPSTGECFYEQFSDNPSREELFKRLQIISPAEILCSPNISADTERLLNHRYIQGIRQRIFIFQGDQKPVFCPCWEFYARLERLPLEWFETTNALTRVSGHFASESDGQFESGMLEGLMDLQPTVLGCLAALQQHLTEFGLHRAIRPDGLQALTFGQDFLHMDSSTIRNLQLFVSDAEGAHVHGSLFWALNHTKTKFGARLLHNWLAKPVRVKKVLEERQESINELLEADQLLVSQLKNLLTNLPDLEKGLTTILHNKCSPMQYFTILDALCHMSSELSALLITMEQDKKSSLLRKVISETISLLDDVQQYRDNINVSAAKEGNKTKLLKDFSAFPNVLKIVNDIENTTHSLDKLRPDIAQKLSLMSVRYTTVSGQDYLIEVKNTYAKSVPVNWRKVSSTKQVGRYRPPAVDTLFGELQCLREKLRAECHMAWIALLQDFSQQYFKHKQAVNNVATLDVFLSLAYVAQQEGFCRPKLLESEDAHITIKRGRHPVVPLLFLSAGQFVPNDTQLNSSEECCMVLSGPNMGGKSCYIRQVALIALLAHIGSYVPAEYAEISLLDSIFTRMGARDELFKGRSTLMVELEETSTILQKVSRRSLVLLDELGRGTGSCDGSAIASATLRHVALEVQCLTLFVTHYPSVMDTVNELEGKAGNYHMAFFLHDEDEGETLTFLYEVVKGAADRSYGINVARLANLDRHLLQRAAVVAADLEKQARNRREIRQSFVGMWQQ